MEIHHLNCGSLYPRVPKTEAIIYCLLVETNQGLLLVDTGFGSKDYAQPTLMMRFFLFMMGVPRRVEETAVQQIAGLGYTREDVRHIVLTHLHLDHAGGLPDFPEAQVHVHRTEHEAAMRPRDLIERAYMPSHWLHGPKWVLHDQTDREWFGFEAIEVIEGLVPKVYMIPLPGHTRGHCGIAVETSSGWLLQSGDAASPFHPDADLHHRGEQDYPAGSLPNWFTRNVIGPHVPRLRKLIQEHGDQVRVISAHDVYSYQELGGR